MDEQYDLQAEEVYGYEFASKPESAVHNGCIGMVVSAIWVKQTVKRGGTEEVRSVTYRPQWGTEVPIAVPTEEEYELPEGMITLENLKHAVNELLDMKD